MQDRQAQFNMLSIRKAARKAKQTSKQPELSCKKHLKRERMCTQCAEWRRKKHTQSAIFRNESHDKTKQFRETRAFQFCGGIKKRVKLTRNTAKEMESETMRTQELRKRRPCYYISRFSLCWKDTELIMHRIHYVCKFPVIVLLIFVLCFLFWLCLCLCLCCAILENTLCLPRLFNYTELYVFCI